MMPTECLKTAQIKSEQQNNLIINLTSISKKKKDHMRIRMKVNDESKKRKPSSNDKVSQTWVDRKTILFIPEQL